MRKYVVEFIGTFFLVFTVSMIVTNPAATPGFGGLAIGSVLMVMIYAGGHISGGHYNPAVTTAVWVRGRCPTSDALPYIAAQLIGAVVAVFVAKFVVGSPRIDPHQIPVARAFVAEFLFTFALAFVVVNVATSKDTAGNSNYGLAIGFTVVSGAYAVGTISGAVFNPAVAVGLTTLGVSPVQAIWVYLAAEFVAGALAGLAFNFLNPDDPPIPKAKEAEYID
jgi:aquaporin Z